MDAALFKLLTEVDTPTVCNAIEVAQGKRGFNRFTRGTMVASHPEAPAMVGYARTARIRAVEPPSEPPEVIRARSMDYYKHMATGPRPAVAVVQDLDVPNAIGAYWGEINTNIHKSFGLSGTLTDGVMRDLGDVPDGYPVVAGSIGPSHGFVHVVDIAQPVAWRSPIHWPVFLPYVGLYLFAQCFYWFPVGALNRRLWFIYGSMFVVSTILNLASHR